METTILVAVTEIKDDVDNTKPVEERLESAMKQMRNHWLITNEDSQLRAAIGAVLLSATDEDKERINAELKVIKALSAATTGVPVDFNAIKFQENPIGIINLWKKTKPCDN